MLAEPYKWLFVGEIPLLYEVKRVARQLNVEIWLNPSFLFKALNLKPGFSVKPFDASKMKYIT